MRSLPFIVLNWSFPISCSWLLYFLETVLELGDRVILETVISLETVHILAFYILVSLAFGIGWSWVPILETEPFDWELKPEFIIKVGSLFPDTFIPDTIIPGDRSHSGDSVFLVMVGSWFYSLVLESLN